MSEQAPAPLAGCPGLTQRIQGTTAGICYGCGRYGAPGGGAIVPRASLDQVSHTWACPDRVSSFAFASPTN